MLNKEELALFLALLSEFAKANHLSAAMMARLFEVGPATMARWMAMSRKAEPSNSLYRWMAEPIETKIKQLNALDAARGTYAAISGQKPAEKIDLLQKALDGKFVW